MIGREAFEKFDVVWVLGKLAAQQLGAFTPRAQDNSAPERETERQRILWVTVWWGKWFFCPVFSSFMECAN